MGGYPELFHPPYQHGVAIRHRADCSVLTVVQSNCHTTVGVRSGRDDGMCQQMKRKHHSRTNQRILGYFHMEKQRRA
jgi:hypothetical protein